MSFPHAGYDTTHSISDSHQYIHSLASNWVTPGATAGMNSSDPGTGTDAMSFLSSSSTTMPQSIITTEHSDGSSLYLNQYGLGTQPPQPRIYIPPPTHIIPAYWHTNAYQSLPESPDPASTPNTKNEVLNGSRPYQCSSLLSDLPDETPANPTVNSILHSKYERRDVNSQYIPPKI
ncbi:hypothetical protein N7540_002126 [Penicillium herquei]|nr:hypothetical protein N7540_002126 [Penicillium herquei]